MEMLLMVLAMSFLGVAVSAVLFSAAVRDQPAPQPPQVSERVPAAPSQFFTVERRSGPPVSIPIELLLLQVERHVQLEQAAAELFHHAPTKETLHSRTASPLVH